MSNKSPGNKQQSSPATASQKPDALMRAIGATLYLFGAVFAAESLFIVVTFDPTDAWLSVLVSVAGSMLFVMTGIGLWRMREWGVILWAIIVGVPTLANFGIALHYIGVVGFIVQTIIAIFIFRGTRRMWKTVKAQ